MNEVLEFVGVAKRYGAHEVLRGVSFAVTRGEVVGLVGVNGAGKTTLIRGLLDRIRFDAGSVTLAGQAHTARTARAAVAYLPERFNPPAFATGAEVLAYLSALHGRPYDPARAAAEAAALELAVEALARPCREYSKGMAQKLGLVAAVLPGCPLLVLDEPMSGLDPKARALFKRRLLALHDEGVTLFFSTHLLADVEVLCDRLVLLHDGQVRYSGTPAALLAAHGTADLEAAFLAAIAPGA